MIGLVVWLPDDHGQRLQQQRHADGRNQRGELWRIAQRPVGNFFDGEVQGCAHDKGDQQRDKQNHPPRCAGHGLLHEADDGPAGQRADHQHLAVRKIDQVDDAVDHGVTQCNQGVHAAQHQTVNDLL